MSDRNEIVSRVTAALEGKPAPVAIRNARKVDARGERRGYWVVSDAAGVIVAAGTGEETFEHYCRTVGLDPADRNAVIDAEGRILTPGYVDIHAHGAWEKSFDDGPDGIDVARAGHAVHGTTRQVLSLITNPVDVICRNIRTVRVTMESGRPDILGCHLEGPFLSSAKKGAQNSDFLHDPDVPMLKRLQADARGLVKLVTLAPEQPGSMEFIQAAAEEGIHVSIGHTVADYETASAAFAAGADHATHLYNGMPSLHHREPAVIGAAFDNKKVMPEIICDGIHVHGSVIRATFAMFGAERMILISDSLRATGMPDGEYPFGGQMIEVHGNRATLLGHPETLAGSVTSLMGCLRQAVKFGIPVADAVRAASYNPARSIGMEDRIGSLTEGKEATFVLLDKETLETKRIVFKGKTVSQA